MNSTGQHTIIKATAQSNAHFRNLKLRRLEISTCLHLYYTHTIVNLELIIVYRSSQHFPRDAKKQTKTRCPVNFLYFFLKYISNKNG